MSLGKNIGGRIPHVPMPPIFIPKQSKVTTN